MDILNFSSNNGIGRTLTLFQSCVQSVYRKERTHEAQEDAVSK